MGCPGDGHLTGEMWACNHQGLVFSPFSLDVKTKLICEVLELRETLFGKCVA